MTTALPGSIAFIERDWLSANHIMFRDGDAATLVDTGYGKFNDVTIDHVDARSTAGTVRHLRASSTPSTATTSAATWRCSGCTEVAALRFRRRNSVRW